MRMPDNDAKADVLLESFGEYLLARLEAKKETKELAQLFQGAQEALRKKLETENAMERAVQHAMAARDEADQTLDGKVRDFYLALQMGHKGKGSNPLMAKYFPKGLTAVTLAPLLDELVLTGKITALLADEENGALKAYAPLIQEASNNLRQAMASHDAAVTAAGLAANATRAQGLLWRDVYRKIYGRLLDIYSSNKPYAESFFKKAPKTKKNDGSPTADQTTPKPPAAKA
jgi:hypothetical protein